MNYDFELMFGHSPGMNMGEYEESTPEYVKMLSEKKRNKKIQVAVTGDPGSVKEIVEEIMNPKEVPNITDGSAVCHGVKHAYEIKENKK